MVRISDLKQLASPETIDLAVEALHDLAQFGRHCVVESGRQGGAESTSVDAAVAQGDALTCFGHVVALGSGDSFDESAHAQSAQVVCCAARPVFVGLEAEERCGDLPELAVGEAHGKQVEDQQAGEHRVDPEVAEAQGGNPALLDDRGMVQVLEGFGAEQGVMAEAFDAQ